MKKLLSVLAALAVVMSLSGCQAGQTDTVISETTTTSSVTQSLETIAPENTDIVYETLAEGQERDWKIEDVLKNDLEIDGIPISIPCTVEELLDTLGDGYSVDESEFIYEGDTITSCKHYSGEFVSIMLYYENERTYNLLSCISESNNINYTTLNVVGFHSIGDIEINEFENNNSLKQCLSAYGLPNQVIDNGNAVSFFYIDDVGYLHIDFSNQKVNSVSGSFIMEEMKNK